MSEFDITVVAPSNSDIRRRALDLLSRREHSVCELRRKLEQRFDGGGCIAAVLAKLVDDKLLSDERFAESYTNYRRGKGFGPRRIAGELRERGLCESLIALHTDESGDIWCIAAAAARKKKFSGSAASTAQEGARQQQFLRYRGFSYRHFSALFSD